MRNMATSIEQKSAIHSGATTLLLDSDVSKKRWFISALLGLALSVLAIGLSQLLPSLVLGELQGADYLIVGSLQIVLVPLAIWVGLRPVGLSFHELGVRGPQIIRDAGIGFLVAAAFALVQFGLVIPLTGGAGREDVAANMTQIGGSAWGAWAFVGLALTGGFAEELLFRAHLLTTLRNGFGRGRGALVVAVTTVVVVFGLLHGYQGWAGVVDTGLYGGLVLSVLFISTNGRITASFVAHAAWNTIAVIVLYRWSVAG